jgi:hypothetical protein
MKLRSNPTDNDLPALGRSGRPRRAKKRLFRSGIAASVAFLGVVTMMHVQPAGAYDLSNTPNQITLTSKQFKVDDVDGKMTVTMYPNGTYQASAHLHNGNWGMRQFTIGCTIKSSSGQSYSFAAKDNIGGTGALSRGGSKYRDPSTSGNNGAIAADWANLNAGATASCRMTVKFDTTGLIMDLLKDVGIAVNTVSSVVALF